jgi:hypothetical protein
MTATLGKNRNSVPGVLLVLNDVVANYEEEFNRWYQEQHVPERLALQGFKTARRYHVIDGQPAYMAVYECDSIEVFASKAYQERLANPTDWTRKIMPGFRNMLRSVCRETWSTGTGVGGGAIVVQCRAEPGKEDLARCFVKDKLAPGLMRSASMVRMSLWEADAAFTGGASPEMALRGGADKNADWVLFLESFDLEESASTLATPALAAAGRDAGLLLDSWTQYRLMHARYRDI